MDALTLGRKLARKRQEAGLTQGDVAARMGTTQAAISKIESGRVLPSFLVVDRFARALGTPMEIVFGVDPRPVTREERRRRVERVLGRDAFNPWDRDPAPVEAESLLADGLTRERFESQRVTSSSRG
jgi:transcriptional regulator with XRE-family HTH domain